jgi:membrane dipeptidase
MCRLVAFIVFSSLFCVPGKAQHLTNSSTQSAAAIHSSAVVVDTHADTPQLWLDEGLDIAVHPPPGRVQLDLTSARQGNLGAEFFSIWVSPTYKNGYARRALDLMDEVRQQVQKHPGQMTMAYSAEDIARARSGPHKRLAALMGVEGGHAIENDIHILRNFYGLGVRYMTLTWTNTNEWADSSGDIDRSDVEHHSGLTEFGKQVVLEMNRLGMMVDISHVADKTFWDAIAISKAPIIASHSSSRALSHSARNLTDEMLRAVAHNGGVVMVNYYSGFLNEEFREAVEAQKVQRDAAVQELKSRLQSQGRDMDDREQRAVEREWIRKIPRPPFKSLVDSIDHIAKVAGIDHVGLGSDFDGCASMPEGMDSAADLPKITRALVERGYASEQIGKILGGNLLRVFRENEQVSHEMNRQLARRP